MNCGLELKIKLQHICNEHNSEVHAKFEDKQINLICAIVLIRHQTTHDKFWQQGNIGNRRHNNL